MKKAAILLLVLSACDSGSEGNTERVARRVVVFAASSLHEAVTEIADRWTAESDRPVQVQFEATSTLARQIQEGAKADLFLTAAPEWLEKVGVIERYDWLSNRLVLVVPTESADVDLEHLESLAIANEQVPAGKYGKDALTHLGVTLPDRTIYGDNVRDVLSKVSEGGAQAGIVYATDALIDPRVRVAYTFPEDSHPKILYSAGLLTENGRAFYTLIRERWALEIARRHGFVDVGK